jgi:hypothetical protein
VAVVTLFVVTLSSWGESETDNTAGSILELAIFGIQYQGAERDPVSLVIMQSVPSARLDHRERLLRLVGVVDHEVRGSFRP